jgi:hypothetical protein
VRRRERGEHDVASRNDGGLGVVETAGQEPAAAEGLGRQNEGERHAGALGGLAGGHVLGLGVRLRVVNEEGA